MDKKIFSKILIVGCGLTGSVTANLIQHEASADIEIWEKENYIGGRFHTFHNPSEPNCSADMGAQYVSATLEFIRSHARFYDELLDKDELVPLGQKIENFRKLSESKMNLVAPGGTSSLIRHFLDRADATVHLGYEVTEMNLKPDTSTWEIKASNGIVKEFNAVILTIPVPEVLKLTGNFQKLNQDDDIRMAMEQVKYSSRYAVTLMYNQSQNVLEELPWSMKYFPDDDIIAFIALDNRKRGQPNELPALVMHTTVKFFHKYSDSSEDEIKDLVLKQLKCLVNNVPEPSHVECIKWDNAQVIDAYIDNPGCVVLNAHPCLICGGDSFTESNFNGCITSALRIVEELLKGVTISKKCHKSIKK
ncbi:renalase isoform X1 [Parasteatoda tepidariorum]|uniref:renalase isoform X1 n=1 Tax=Parasteatoda tepidariorum TaxID=114398 RepID=UPI00077FA891|nr:renalase isoform X1 [Parasteatoda tepidariorum]